MEIKDYIFQVNWEDRNKESYVVAMLAQLDEEFYLVFKDKEDIETAYKQGYIGIPGFSQQMYKSGELFDFFKNRISQETQSNPCAELVETKGISMIDSFFVEPIPERMIPKYKKIILETYELQERRKQLEGREVI